MKHKKLINLAMQGGGSHGAYTWGALDAILEDGRLTFDGISATSAGAMNAVVLAQGLLKNDNDEARQALHDFWTAVSAAGTMFSPFQNPWPSNPWQNEHGNHGLENSPFYMAFDAMSRMFSPSQLNPMDINPLKDILKDKVDFEALKKETKLKLNICATNVETGKSRIFKNDELSLDAVMASACLPLLFRSVKVGEDYFWDGGYMGNPAIYPLIYECGTSDVLIIHINPIYRKGVPDTASEILDRINEISFNSSLMQEMRAIDFVARLIEQGKIKKGEMKSMRIHSIRSDEEMAEHSASSKLNTDWNLLTHLRDKGKEAAKAWLKEHFDKVGKQSSVDVRKEFL